MDTSVLCACGDEQSKHEGLQRRCMAEAPNGWLCMCPQFVPGDFGVGAIDMKTPPLPPAPPIGAKHDADKDRWDLLPVGPAREVVRVLTHGARKYSPGNWQHVDDARNRYYAAALRHLTSWADGEQSDPDSELPHLAHAVCSLLFLLWFEARR